MFGRAFLLEFFCLFIHERNSVVCPNGGRLSILVVRVSLAEGVGRSLRHADEACIATTLTRLQVNRKGKIMPLTAAAQVSSPRGSLLRFRAGRRGPALHLPLRAIYVSCCPCSGEGSRVRKLEFFQTFAVTPCMTGKAAGCLSGV